MVVLSGHLERVVKDQITLTSSGLPSSREFSCLAPPRSLLTTLGIDITQRKQNSVQVLLTVQERVQDECTVASSATDRYQLVSR